MAILSFSTAPSKGGASTVTLNKSELYALPEVSGDAFFSVESNVKSVVVVYASPVGGQSKSIKFDASLASPTASIDFSSSARDAFEIIMIMLRDFDDGELKIGRSSLASLGLDISLAVAPPPSGGVVSLYRFENNGNDSVGSFNLSGNGSYTPSGFQGSAVMQFDQVDNLYKVAPTPLSSIGSGAFTIEAWVKFQTGGQYQTIFRYGFPNTDTDNPDAGNLSVYLDSNSLLNFIDKREGQNANAWTGPNISSFVGDSAWHHIAVTRRINDPFWGADTLNLFVDGVRQLHLPLFGPNFIMPSNAKLEIGYTPPLLNPFDGSPMSPAGAFIGAIDDLRISNINQYEVTSFSPTPY